MARLPGSNAARVLLLAPTLCVLAAPAAAVEPGFRLYLDAFPLRPLERVVLGKNAGQQPLSTLTAEGFADAVALQAASAWTFLDGPGNDRVLQFGPVDPAWSCYVPNGCGGAYDPTRSDLLFLDDDWAAPRTRSLSALDFDGTDRFLLLSQISDEAGNEVRTCFSQTVPFVVFPNLDGSRRYLAEGDPGWSSPNFDCAQDANQGSNCGSGGTNAYLSDGNGTLGRIEGRVARAGTLTLPSGHVVDTVLIEVLASFEVYGTRLFGSCAIEAQRLRQYLLMWMLPHHGPILQLSSPGDTASLAAFTSTNSTVLAYGLLPPLSLQATGVFADSVSLSWDPGTMGGFAPDSFDVHWGTEPGTVTPPPFSATGIAQTGYTVTGLQPDTRYCFSVTSNKTYTDPVSNQATLYRSIALPDTVGADIDGDGTRDTSYPPEICLTTASAGPRGLLRDHLSAIAPPAPPIATVLPLDPVLDLYQPGFTAGSLEPDANVLGDLGRPLVFYAWDTPGTLRAVKEAPRIRIY